jgi:DNA polymerase III delta prime subunit
MSNHSTETETETSAQSSLDGYWYQLKVSVLFALELLANKQQTDQIILEPASEEDLETEFADEPGALTQGLTVKTKKMVIQCKLRNTGPWKITEIRSLLAHGKKRTPAKEMLEASDVHYLLVTSADLFGVARNLKVNGPTQWNRLKPMPKTLASSLPRAADGRVAVWNNLDQEKVEYRISRNLVERFRVPLSQTKSCVEELEKGALARMKGARAGVWTREEVINVVEAHGGYDGVSRDLHQFVPPTNWEDLLEQLRTRNAIVLTGPSGTGKTTTSKALIATLREENPGLSHIKIEGGPERLRDDKTTGPVVFEIEDPWGKYRTEPDSLPWNDAISEFLVSASPDRMFVITSRSDVMKGAKLKSLDDRFVIKLLAGHYRASDRGKLFDMRLKGLPRAEQVSALKYRSSVIKNLTLPLEVDRFFGAAGLGPKEGENTATYMNRCIDDARKQSIERSLCLAVEGQEMWEGAAVLWALIRARKKLSFNALEDIEYDLCEEIPKLEDKLSAFTSFLVAGGNFRQDKTTFSCSHPRVEAGLEQSMLEKPKATSRTLNTLLDVLVRLDEHNHSDWGVETAAQIVAMARAVDGLRISVSKRAQASLDDWLTQRLACLDGSFGDDLSIAAKVGSKKCAVAELARWLEESPIDRQWFNMTSWKEPKKSVGWYDWLSGEPHTHAICDAFVTRIVPFRNGSFQGKFHESIAKLSPNLTPSFLQALRKIIGHGYNPNADTLIDGALVDAGAFAQVFTEAARFFEGERNSQSREKLLPLYNRDYDDEAIDHYWESMGEDGHTATEILQAYIELRRELGEWDVLVGHPNLPGFIWDWLHVAQKCAQCPSTEEMLTLHKLAKSSRYESDFWKLVEKHYDPAVLGLLHEYLTKGSENDEARTSATRVALKHARPLIEEAFSETSAMLQQRLLELALDVQTCLVDEQGEDEAMGLDLVKLTTATDQATQQAISTLLGHNNDEISAPCRALLTSIPEDTHLSLNLAVSGVLMSCGEDIAGRLKKILSAKLEVDEGNIDFATHAMRLAARIPDQSLAELGLKHDFARVRVEAMNAVFVSSTDAMPPQLLETHCDPSSLVRRRFVEMLREKQDSSHIPTLIRLSYDTWTPDHRQHHEENISYPISENAIELLREQPSLSDDVYSELVKSVRASKNYDVRLQLLRTMVRHGSVARQEKLVKLAIGEGRPTLQALVARALFIESESFDSGKFDLIDDDDLVSVSPDVCIWLCMLIGLVATENRLMQAIKKLATDPDRRVFVSLILLTGPEHRTEEQYKMIASFLPNDVVARLEKMAKTECSEDLAFLDALGEVKSVERIKSAFRIWFNKKAKTAKRKPRGSEKQRK